MENKITWGPDTTLIQQILLVLYDGRKKNG